MKLKLLEVEYLCK